MSRRTFHFGTYEVTTGWDNPLNCYHLTIIDKSLVDEETEGIVYDNISDAKRFLMKLMDVLEVLSEWNIAPPQDLITDLWLDQNGRVGNYVMTYADER